MEKDSLIRKALTHKPVTWHIEIEEMTWQEQD